MMTRRPLSRRSSVKVTAGTWVGTLVSVYGGRAAGRGVEADRSAFASGAVGRTGLTSTIVAMLDTRLTSVRSWTTTDMAARPATRREPATSAPSPRVRDLRPPSGGPIVEWDVRSAYDFVFSLSDDAGSTDDLPITDRTWLAEGKARLRETGGAAMELYGKDLTVVLAGVAVDRPEITDAASILEALGTTPDDTIVDLFLGEELRDPDRRDTAERARAGDEAAIESMMEHFVGHLGKEQQAWLANIYRDPASVIRPAIDVLAAWLPTYQAIEPRVQAMIERDVELRAGDRATLAAIDLIERTTGGIRWLSEPGVRRVILAPSYFSRPYNLLLGSADWRLFGYPIADAALDAADPLAPPPAVVRLHRALGDETRLRILRLLRDRDLYLTEIAQAARAVEADDQASPGPAPIGRSGHRDRSRDRHLLQPPTDASRRRVRRDQALPPGLTQERPKTHVHRRRRTSRPRVR